MIKSFCCAPALMLPTALVLAERGPSRRQTTYHGGKRLGMGSVGKARSLCRASSTPGSAHDSTHDSVERDTLLLGNEAAFYADAGYSSKKTRAKLARFGLPKNLTFYGLLRFDLSLKHALPANAIAAQSRPRCVRHILDLTSPGLNFPEKPG